MRKVYNFGAGPAMLPEEVIRTAQAEMLDWQGTGVSSMELGHRGAEFQHIADQSEADLRQLMSIPDNYKVFFLAGGASAQFAMVPMNLLAQNGKADYIDTGIWSKKAIAEALRFGEVNIASQTAYEDDLATIPEQSEWRLNPEAAYVHYTVNETIAGLEFQWTPNTANVPLVADMTSMILSRPIDVSQFGIIYAGTQKNAGQAGLTIVIVREDLIQECVQNTPTLFMYKTHLEHASFYNTPPTYSWYMTSLVLEWLKKQGGVNAIYAINQRKANMLYDVIDQFAGFYVNRVLPRDRSMMNVVFFLQNEDLTESFIAEAQKINLAYLRGHRLVGGIRASIYNAMPEEGVKILADFMADFAKRHG